MVCVSNSNGVNSNIVVFKNRLGEMVVLNSNGVNSNSDKVGFIGWLVVSNSNGVNSNSLSAKEGYCYASFQTPTE